MGKTLKEVIVIIIQIICKKNDLEGLLSNAKRFRDKFWLTKSNRITLDINMEITKLINI